MRFSIMLLALCFIGLGVNAYAEPFGITYHGENYDQKYIGLDGNGGIIYQWTSAPPRLYDYTDSNNIAIYKDYILEDNPTSIKLQTANAGSLVFSKTTCSYQLYNSGLVDGTSNAIINGISWTIKGKQNNTSTWSAVNSINNAACNVAVQTTESTVTILGNKTASVGTFQIALHYSPGKGIKETMRAYNNNPAWNNHNIGFTEKFQVPRFINLGNQEYDLSLYNNTSLGRQWIENNQSKLMKLSDRIFYDFGIGFENLDDIKITWDGSHAYLSLNYLYTNTIVPYQEWFEVDPIFGYTVGTKKVSQDTAAVQATCTQAGIANSTQIVTTQLGNSGLNELCRLGSFQWDTTSIPDTATILNTTMRFDVVGTTSNSNNCDYVSMETKPSTATQQQHWDDIAGNDGTTTVYVNADSKCNTIAANYVLDLGASADAKLQSQLPVNWFAVGNRQDGFPARTATLRQSNLDTVELQVTYTFAPTPPSNLSCTGVPFGGSCTWTASVNATAVTTYYIETSTNNSTFANRTSTGNVTSYTITGLTSNKLYYARINATENNVYNTTSSNHASFTTDTVPDAPSLTLQPLSETIVNATSVAGASNGGDIVDDFSLRCEVNAQGGWQTVVSNSTLPSNRKHTINSLGLVSGDTLVCQWRDGNDVGWSNWSANATANTFEPTAGSITLSSGVVGDVIQLNGTISITAGSPSPVNITQSRFYVDGSLQETRAETISINVPGSDTLDPFWYQFTNAGNHIFAIKVTATNSSGTVILSPVANVTTSREYPPDYFDSITDPATLGVVNYTTSRFNSEDGVQLKVNRDNVAVGQTWPVNCILQTNSEAAQTKNQSQTWQGTWRNYSSTGYVNASWTGLVNTHGYITCVNPPNILFTTTSFTNSSLALFGIEIFDDSYGSMLGVPVGIFFLAMAGSMANKRTAPTWIVVVLGMAGVMATIGFFTINPLVWGLALVSAIFGVIVNQKVF